MHYLHAILVELPATAREKISAQKDFTSAEIDSLQRIARRMALGELDCYQDQVFDWYEQNTAGRWKDKYPGKRVLRV